MSTAASIMCRLRTAYRALLWGNWLPMDTMPPDRRDGRKVLLTDGTEVMLCSWEDHAFGSNGIGAWVAAFHPDSGWASDVMRNPTGWQDAPLP